MPVEAKRVAPELPFNQEAEKVVLGSAMIKKDYCLDVLNSLEQQDFFLGRHQIIYQAISALSMRNVSVDVLTVAEELQNLKELENIGGAKYLAECTNKVVASSTLTHYIGIVQDNAVLRKMLTTIRAIDNTYLHEEIENINDFILDSENKFKDSIAKRHISNFLTTKEIAPIFEQGLERLQDQDNDTDVIGVTTGYDRINHITQGFKGGELIIVAARPSVGKTALCLNFAYRIATRAKKAVAIFSLEMSKEDLFNRLVSISSCVSARDIKSGKINKTASERLKVMNGIKEIANSKIYIDDTPSIKLNDIIAKATKLQAHEPDLGLIVVDYLGLVSIATKGKGIDNRQEEVRRISLALKALARDLNVPVIAVSQLSRAVEQRDSKRPMMSDLRDSGNIEQDADIVMLLYRGDYYDSSKKNGTNNAANKKGGQLTDRDKFELAKAQKEKELGSEIPGNASYTEVIIAKNRSGQTGTARLFFYKDYVRFGTSEVVKQIKETSSSDGSSVKIVINKIVMNLETDLVLSVNYSGTGDERKIDTISVDNLKYSGKTLNLTLDLVDFASKANPINATTGFIDFNSVKTLLDFGLNTTLQGYYRLNCDLTLDIIFSGFTAFEYDINFYIYVDGKHAYVYGTIPLKHFIGVTSFDSYILFKGREFKSGTTEFLFEPYTGNGSEDEDGDDVGGYFHILQSIVYKYNLFTTKTEKNYYVTESKNFIETKNMIYYILCDALGLDEWIYNKISSSMDDEGTGSGGNAPDIENIFYGKGQFTYNDGKEPSWDIDLNLGKLLNTSVLGLLQIDIKTLAELDDDGNPVKGYLKEVNVYTEILSGLLKVNADIQLVNAGAASNAKWPTSIQNKYNTVIGYRTALTAAEVKQYMNQRSTPKTWLVS